MRVRWKIATGVGHVDHICQEVGGQHHQGDDHEDPLHQRVVQLPEGVEEMEADPGIVEDDLNQDLAGDHKADRDREVGDDGQERVAGRVPHHPPGRQTLGRGDQDEVFIHGRDHLVAHRENEAGDRGEDHRRRGQDCVAEDADDVGQVQSWGDRVDVVSEQARKPLEHRPGLTEDQDQHQGEEEVRKRLEERGDRHHPLDQRAAAPSHQNSDRRARHEADGRGDHEQPQSPRQVREDEAAHRGVFGPRMAEVAMQKVAPVPDVLVPHARVDVVAKLLFDGHDALGVAVP